MGDITALGVVWYNKEAEDLFKAHKRVLAEIQSSFAVASVTATQMAVLRDPIERRKMAERMEAECKPWRDAMADLMRKHSGPFVEFTTPLEEADQ